MTVLFTVLKIIGIVLLCILALLLLIVALVLFVPIRYSVNGNKSKEDIKAKGRVSWLLHIIHFSFYYEDKSVPYIIRIFGFPFKRGYFIGAPSEDQVNEQLNEQENKQVNEQVNIEHTKEESKEEKKEDKKEYINEDVKNKNIKKEVFIKENHEREDNKKESLWDRITKFFKTIYIKILSIIDKIKSFFDNISSGIEKIQKEYDFYQRFLEDEHNKAAMQLALEEVKKVLGSVLPSKIAGDVSLGFEDPATTGQILVFLSILYPALPRKLSIYPDFENVIFEGNIKIKGRIYLIVLLIAAIKLYFSKDIKRFLQIYKKHKNKTA